MEQFDMKLRIVSSRDEIRTLNSNEKMVHLAFRPNNVDLLELIKRCPELRAIQIPHSYFKTISDACLVLMNIEGIQLLAGDVWGHRKDLNEYLIIDKTIIQEIISLAKKGALAENIADQIKENVRLSPDFIKYIIEEKATEH
jgi:hypothetical protein